jgi:hypothetical protein
MKRSPPVTAWVVSLLLATSVCAQTQVFNLAGPMQGSAFGTAAKGVGDLNGDGIRDFVAGAPSDDTNGADSGSVWFYSGYDGTLLRVLRGPLPGVAPLRVVDAAGDVNQDGSVDVLVGGMGFVQLISGANGAVLYLLTDPFSLTFARTVAGIGDVNQDGVPDFAAGDPESQGGRGRIVVWSGATGTVIFELPGGTVTSLTGTAYGEKLGASLAGAGYVDGDGVPDFVAGAPERRVCTGGIGGGTCTVIGRVYVYAGATGGVIHTWTGSSAEVLGRAVDRAGDVNGDGRDDVIAGIPSAEKARVFSGATGLSLADVVGIGMPSPFTFESFGSAVAGAGDVNADGYDDVIVGAPCFRTILCSPGYVRVFAGLTGILLYSLSGTALGDSFGISVDGIGDVNQDGTDDFIVGGGSFLRVFSGSTLAPASVTPLGTGCWTPALVPSLSLAAPILGQIASVAVMSAPIPSFGWLAVGPPLVVPVLLPSGPLLTGTCNVWIDPTAHGVLSVFLPDGTGSWSLSNFVLPSIPTLAGTSLALQAVLFPAGGGLAFTNAALATLGY